jgi:hypothetical protein
LWANFLTKSIIGYYYVIVMDSITCAGPLLLAEILMQGSLENQHALVTKNLGETISSESEFEPLSTSFDTVFLVDDIPYKLLYPAEKFGPTGFFTVGMQDLGSIPDHERPSQGWKWYGQCRQDLYSPSGEHAVFLHSDYETSWGFVFWDNEKLAEATAVPDDTEMET